MSSFNPRYVSILGLPSVISVLITRLDQRFDRILGDRGVICFGRGNISNEEAQPAMYGWEGGSLLSKTFGTHVSSISEFLMTFVSFPQQDCGWSLLTFPTLSLQSGQASGLESAKPAHGKLRGTFGPPPRTHSGSNSVCNGTRTLPFHLC